MSKSGMKSNIDYVQWAIKIADDDRYYYAHNSDPFSFSCSTLVAKALYVCGYFKKDVVPADGHAIGGNDRSVLHRALFSAGFKKYAFSSTKLKEGDILVVRPYHIAIHIKNGIMVGANGNGTAEDRSPTAILTYNYKGIGEPRWIFRLPEDKIHRTKEGKVMLSNCGRDERGLYSGGQAGDQDGGEWCIRNWYVYPLGGWNWVLHHPSEDVREWIAKLATEAAHNDLIGYDQAERYTFWEQLKSSGYRPKNIAVPCEADCSSGVAAIAKAVGYLLNSEKLKGISIYAYTGNLRQVLTKAGFEALNASKYLTGDEYLCAGDFLLNTENHVCTCITNGSKADTDTETGFKFKLGVVKYGSQSGSVYILQGIFKARGFYNGELDGMAGDLTREAILLARKKLGTTKKYCDSVMWTKLLNLEMVNGYWIAKRIEYGSDKSDSILLAQEMLTSKGYYKGKLDGSFGDETKKAVTDFQRDKGLPHTGVVDKKTWKALLNK